MPVDLTIGWVGLVNSGKTSIVQALLGQPDESSPVPQSTDQPRVGVKHWIAPEIQPIIPIINPPKLFPVEFELVDICGFIEGTGEERGLAASHLAQLRRSDVLAMVIRCFRDDSISYSLPVGNLTENYSALLKELVASDRPLIATEIKAIAKQVTFGRKDLEPHLTFLETCRSTLDAGKPLSDLDLSPQDIKILNKTNVLTHKPRLAVLNVGEESSTSSQLSKLGQEASQEFGIPAVALCASLEREIVDVGEDKWAEFSEAFGGYTSRAENFWKAVLATTSYVVYVTFGHLGLKCWVMPKGLTLIDAAKRMHSDFAKNLAGGEVLRIEDIISAGSIGALSKVGAAKLRPKNYVVQDFDILYFRTTA